MNGPLAEQEIDILRLAPTVYQFRSSSLISASWHAKKQSIKKDGMQNLY